ncbi:MAG: efflux RND transporter periplasmic adaptor subunit [Smithellaceae bacterium]
MKKRLIIISIFLLILGITACNTSKVSVPTPVTVEVKKVGIADEHDDFAYSGTIEEAETIPLSFSVLGNVSKVLVAEGDPVKKGQLLATVDNTTHRNSYEMALASLKKAEDAYKRLSQMYQNGNLPAIKYVEVQTGFQQARAAATIAKKNLDDCNLYATKAGIIGKRAIEPGMTATPNVTSITIVKIAKVYARVSISENEISMIKKGQRAHIKISALELSTFDGIVEEVGVMADPLAHTYKIKIGIQNANRKIKPGMVCNVTIANTSGIRNLIVPSEAVMVDETGKNFVYTVDATSNTAIRKFVKLGKLGNNGIEIVEGLEENELVVTSGQHKLVDHFPVHITNL